MEEQKVTKEDDFERFLVRLPKALKRKVKSIAALSGRSVQDVAEEVWAQWVREQEIKKEAKDE